MKERIKKWQYMIMQQPYTAAPAEICKGVVPDALTQSNQQVKFINA